MSERLKTPPAPDETAPDVRELLDPLVFDDLTPREVVVRIGGARYLLREASEGAATQYRNATLRAMRVLDGKLVGVDGMADVEPLLVSLCLFQAHQPPADRNGVKPAPVEVPVPLVTVKKWPSRIVRKLFEQAKEMSELDEEDTSARLRLRVTRAKTELLKKEPPTTVRDFFRGLADAVPVPEEIPGGADQPDDDQQGRAPEDPAKNGHGSTPITSGSVMSSAETSTG